MFPDLTETVVLAFLGRTFLHDYIFDDLDFS